MSSEHAPQSDRAPPGTALEEATLGQIFAELQARSRYAILAIVVPDRRRNSNLEFSTFSWHGGSYPCEGLARAMLRRLSRAERQQWDARSGRPKPPESPI